MPPTLPLSVGRPQAPSLLRGRRLRWQARPFTTSQAHPIGLKYLVKLKDAKDDWDAQAKQIRAGEVRCVWDLLTERGFVKDTAGSPEAIRNFMIDNRIGAYAGIDPTGPSLHIGHLLPLMALFWMYLHGYHTFTVIGGSTAKIGDPTGRLQTREIMRSSTLTENLAMIHFQLKRLWANVETMGLSYGYKREWSWKRGIINNNAWWNKETLLEVLRGVGSAVRIGPMLSRDTVKKKLHHGDGMSLGEFVYPIMQGYDWWKLHTQLGVQMQIGGSDQFGNIVSGMDVVKACRNNNQDPATETKIKRIADLYGFTVPLLTDSQGLKLGKSAGNAIWLDPYRTSPFDLYGYFVRRSDAEVEKFLKLFTFLPLDKINEVMEEHRANPPKRVAQHLLAREVTTLVLGAKQATEAQAEHYKVYGSHMKGPVRSARPSIPPQSPEQYVDTEKGNTINDMPRINMKLPRTLIETKSLAHILYACGLAKSSSDGHRIVKSRGAYIGGSPGQKPSLNKGTIIGDIQFTPVMTWNIEYNQRYIIADKILILRKGKHNLRVIELVSDEAWEESGRHYPGEPNTGKFRGLLSAYKAIKQGADPREVMSSTAAQGSLDFPYKSAGQRETAAKLNVIMETQAKQPEASGESTAKEGEASDRDGYRDQDSP